MDSMLKDLLESLDRKRRCVNGYAVLASKKYTLMYRKDPSGSVQLFLMLGSFLRLLFSPLCMCMCTP